VRARLAALPMPLEYHAEVFGNATTEQADLTRTLVFGGAALIGVFLLLQAAVASWRRAALMLVSLPLSVAGAVLAAPLAGGAWSTGSLAGVFAVFALALRGSVLLGRQIEAAEQDGPPEKAGEAVLAAARDRAAPLLQSALVTAAVLLPAAVLGSRAGLEFLHPLAVTVLGGLVSMIIAQLFLLPALLMTTAGRHQEQPLETRPLAEAASE